MDRCGPLKRLAPALLLAGALCLPLPGAAREGESEPTSPVGSHLLRLGEGWNLASLPLVKTGESFSSLLGPSLQRGAGPGEADLVLAWDREQGLWRRGWFDTEGELQGDLGELAPSVHTALWLHIQPGARSLPLEIPLVGTPVLDSTIHRGLFPAGLHPVGVIWSDPLPLEHSGLQESGLAPSPGLLGPTGALAGVLFAWDREEQRFLASWLTPDGWRGRLQRLEPGRGYLLYAPQMLAWSHYPRPDLAGRGVSPAGGERNAAHHRPAPAVSGGPLQPPVPVLPAARSAEDPAKPPERRGGR